ncbi:hypothetical protein [Marinobacter sp. CA1]|uniref:hypothetical protein n=1 Tax=Marinobacter sp. CA1 TaxID=2817656 RepID=UPI001D089296|nr:hypothetical protein [Marinobacter sp. CA1]UDL06442.1 hypothetical protein J2887_06695 [Marinobacter sp. CA1]
MISSSQVSFSQSHSRTTSQMDASQYRLARQSDGGGDGPRELFARRDASYHYRGQQQVAFSGNSQIQGSGGTRVMANNQVIERTADVMLQGRQAIRVSRAALGDNVGVGSGNSASVNVTASRYSFYSMNETRSFAASGSIEVDGETIDFTLSLRQQQSHSYEYSESLQITERQMTDPLVINFGSATASLTDSLFEFDLNGDGEDEQLATLGSGSGYLVFDRNGNGKVDDGSELFGPQSGSGFADLAQFDSDGNQWLDANDEAFSSLQVWVQTAGGGQELRSLEEVGVRALYVEGASDRFTMTNSQGVPLGQVKASGIYLTDDGEVRTLEELDLMDQRQTATAGSDVVMNTPLGAPNEAGTGLSDEQRLAAIREALAKLNEIREQQKEMLERGEEEGVLSFEEYMSEIDRMRLALLASQAEKEKAANTYRDVSEPG